MLYIVGGYKMDKDGEVFGNPPIQTCECLDLTNLQMGWKTIFGSGEGHLPTLLWSTNTTLGTTFACKINDDCAIIGGLSTRKLFIFCDNKFFLMHGEDLQYDAFNSRHHKLVRWPNYK